MGNNCTSVQPTVTNYCNVNQGEYMQFEMQGFCTADGPAGDNSRQTFCQEMSKAGEWGDPASGSICNYNDCNYYQSVSPGCCTANCCGIVGSGLFCKRLQFTGAPLQCCLNDYNCHQQDLNLCYSDTAQQNTCANGLNGTANLRSVVSSDCRDIFNQYCTGTLPTDDPNSTEWLNRWTEGGPNSCGYLLARNLFYTETNPCVEPPQITPGVCNITPPLPINSAGYFWGQTLIDEVIKKYNAQGFELGALPGFNGYNPFQDYLYENVCCPYPGLCQPALQNECAQHTPERMSLNPALAQWCGCHLSPETYENYSTRFNIPPQCTPMCNRVNTIPIVGLNAAPVRCEQDICLIDNVTVNLVNAQIGGGIEFNQICGNCGPKGLGQCSCIIDGAELNIENSSISGTVIPVQEGCGSFTCTQTNPGTTGPSSITVPCGNGATGSTGGTGYNPYTELDAANEKARAEAKKKSVLTTLLIIGAGLLILFVILYFIYPGLNKQGSKQTNSSDQIAKDLKDLGLAPNSVNNNLAANLATNSINPATTSTLSSASTSTLSSALTATSTPTAAASSTPTATAAATLTPTLTANQGPSEARHSGFISIDNLGLTENQS